VLGAPKCGTTAMYDIMRRHPNFVEPFEQMKELLYLQDIPNFEAYDYKGILKVLFDLFFGTYKGPHSYRKFFPLKSEMRSVKRKTGHIALTGDFSPITLYCPIAARRIKELTPDAKLIIMLRNPINRAYSEFNMFTERGAQESRTFEKAIEDEFNHVPQSDYLLETYIKRGIYEPYIRMYFNLFENKNILVIKSEDFFSDSAAEVHKILTFLDLPAGDFMVDKDGFNKNETFYGKRMKKETRDFLIDYYRPYNESLYDFLKMNMKWEILTTPHPVA
jgi:hypothetical protein